MQYYKSVCESLGLNPLTRPFAYISLNNKLTLYALKDCTEQLRKIHEVSIEIKSREAIEGVYVVTVLATNKTGRKDESVGAVAFENLKGEARANALMKAETKAKRRVTLSFCGLGMLDETEVGDEVAAMAAAAPHEAHVVQPELGNGGEPIYDWRNIPVHFGDRHGPGCDADHPHGRPLGELSEAALNWFQTKWEGNPDNPKDVRLRRALDMSLGKIPPDLKPEPAAAKQPELVSAEIPGKTAGADDGPPA